LLKKELEEDAEILEFLTPTGLVKTELSNSSKSLCLTPTTKLSEETEELTGLPPTNTNTENPEDSLLPEESTEVSNKKDQELNKTDHLLNNHGSEEIKSLLEDSDEERMLARDIWIFI
jgi:hypothetical protein